MRAATARVTSFELPRDRRRRARPDGSPDGSPDAAPDDSRLFSAKDAEEAVLGAMLMRDPEAIEKTKQLLDESAFETSANRLLFRAIVELSDNGIAVDPITVTAQLEKNGSFEAAGGRERLSYLQDVVPTSANVEYHAKIVRERSTLRKAAVLLRLAKAALETPGGDPAPAFQALREFSLEHDKAGAAARMPIYDDDELIALPEPQWDVPGIIPRNALVQIFGAYATYKSFIALLFAFCRQLGLAIHGREVRAGPVFYICAEGAIGMRLRTAALRRYLGVQFAGVNFIPQSVHLNVSAEVLLAVATIRGRLRPNTEPWVIVDTRSRCLLGNENSTEDMSSFVRGCDTLRQELNATVIVLHHPGWGNDERGRGAYDFDASCDTIIKVERDAERVTLSCTKMKDGPEFAPIVFEARPAGKSLVFEAVELSAGKLTGQRLQTLRALHQNSTDLGLSYKAWLEATGLKPSSFNKAREWLAQQVYVRSSGGKWKTTDAGVLALHSTDYTDTPPSLHPEADNPSERQLHSMGGTVSTHGGVARESRHRTTGVDPTPVPAP